jgi:hypothetical protein
MYLLINEHIGTILDAVNFKRDVNRYIRLMERFPGVNVAEDDAFQQLFKAYWQLNPARLNRQFISRYFELLERLKCNPDITVEAVVRQLYPIPTHQDRQHQDRQHQDRQHQDRQHQDRQHQDRQSVQLSFSTKLIHMLHPHEPVYDSAVQAFYFLPKGANGGTVDRKLARLLRAIEFLRHEYGRVLRMGLLKEAIAAFRERYDPNQIITDEKAIDTLIWQFVKLLQSGAIRDQQITYS